MLECIILGDGIAVGTSRIRSECISYSTKGYNTQQWNKTFAKNNLAAKSVIISLGTNDSWKVNTFQELMAIRTRVEAQHVYWILPPCNDKFCRPKINEIIEIIARNYGDSIIKTDKLQTDGMHPNQQGYRELAEKTQ